MTPVVEQDDKFNPVNIGQLGTVAVMPGTDDIAHLVEQ